MNGCKVPLHCCRSGLSCCKAFIFPPSAKAASSYCCWGYPVLQGALGTIVGGLGSFGDSVGGRMNEQNLGWARKSDVVEQTN